MKYMARGYFKYQGKQMEPGMLHDGPVKPSLVGRRFLIVDDDGKMIHKDGKRVDGNLLKPRRRIQLDTSDPHGSSRKAVEEVKARVDKDFAKREKAEHDAKMARMALADDETVSEETAGDEAVAETVEAKSPKWPSKKKKKGAKSRSGK